jgi:DNA helicase HerA-like ATPase
MYAQNLCDRLKPKTSEELVIIGQVNFRKRKDRFGLLPEDRLRHLWILGKTGSGKSTLLANLLAQDLEKGQGCALLDPHGDLVEAVLQMVPRQRVNQVLLFSPAESAFPVSFNIFRQGRTLHPSPSRLASELVSVFRKQWADSWGPRLEHLLRNAVLAIASDSRATLLFLYRFLTETSLREQVVSKLADPVVRQFWTKEFPGYGKSLQSEALSPVLNKLGAFVSQPTVRHIVSQERSRVDLPKLINDKGVLLANLATGLIGEDASHLLGGLLLSSIQLAAMQRSDPDRRFIVYVDEFQNFVSDALPGMLSESRKFGLGLVLSHQYLSQLPRHLQDAVLGNVGSKILFRVGANDARILEPEFFPPFTALDLQSIGSYQAVIKLLAHGKELDPFTATTLPRPSVPIDATKLVAAIKEQSRQRYCQPRAEVEAAIKGTLPDTTS